MTSKCYTIFDAPQCKTLQQLTAVESMSVAQYCANVILSFELLIKIKLLENKTEVAQRFNHLIN